MPKSIIKEKAIIFALQIIKLNRELLKKKDFVLSKQILRSGTSIGANIEEALSAHSKKEFLYKMNIAYSESKETLYWLKLLNYENSISQDLFKNIKEINNILASIVLKVKKQLNISGF